MNAVIYARYSSAGQRDVSIEDQIQVNKKYAAEHDLTVLSVYADRAISGTTDRRPQFQKMVANSAKKLFQVVLVYKTDRFARNRFDSAIYKKKLKDNGVKVISVMEPIPEGAGGEILEAIYETMAETYSKSLSENINRGLMSNARKCMANTMPPFGYAIDKETRKYILDPVTAPVAKRIFDMAATGQPLDKILTYVASMGYKKKYSWLYNVLRNERYTGVYIYKDIRQEGGMPALISKEVFDKVRTFSKRRQQNPQSKPHKYMLSGKIFCGYCGSGMNGEDATNRWGKTYRYYACTGKKKHTSPGCPKHRIRSDYLEHEVVIALSHELFTEDNIARLADGVVKLQEAEQAPIVRALQDKLQDMERRITNLMRAIETAACEPVTDRITELQEQKKELLQQIDAEQLKSIPLSREVVAGFIRQFAGGDTDDPDYAAGVINTFVTRVDVWDDYAIITYDANGDNTVQAPLKRCERFHKWWRWRESNPRPNILPYNFLRAQPAY